MNVGIIGAGAIGKKRSLNLGTNVLKAVANTNIEKAHTLANANPEIKVFSDYKKLLNLKEIDIVIVATRHNTLASITLDAIEAKKHVLVEKPVACNSEDIKKLIVAAKRKNVKVHVGYNQRSHPAIIATKNLINSNTIGDLMYIRGRFGHGGRVGYDKEWRADPKISGGGCLIDLGVHLIDLSRMFLGDFTNVKGSMHTYFWNMPVEDNAFIHLETNKGQTAWLQVSCTEWKNMFSFEIYGKYGKILAEGLGGSYGTEKLTLYKMSPKMEPPETTIWECSFSDSSWNVEFNEFVHAIKNNTEPECNLHDALETMKIVEQIYKINTTRGKT